MIHIDFGFLLSNAPGKGIKFERAPFKLTNDFVQILGGLGSKLFKAYRDAMI
jgi:phosphatidylinositol kinase/protein kinase (PI-3  family)